MRFWLGTHRAGWLERTDVPLFISRVQFARRATLPRALGPWALDSGGYTALNGNGRWDVTAEQYVELVQRCEQEIGNLAWAAPMDWMCEPEMITGGVLPNGLRVPGTGLSVEEHQHRTVQNLLDLRAAAPGVPFAPVLQGWTLDDYTRCAVLYGQAGVDLASEPIVAVGSVCRRQREASIGVIMRELADAGYRLHGFGVKVSGLADYGVELASADSMAWSHDARRGRKRLDGCAHKGDCRNCMRFALRWRERVMRAVEQGRRAGRQMTLAG